MLAPHSEIPEVLERLDGDGLRHVLWVRHLEDPRMRETVFRSDPLFIIMG